jgi:hypothetical protein
MDMFIRGKQIEIGEKLDLNSIKLMKVSPVSELMLTESIT